MQYQNCKRHNIGLLALCLVLMTELIFAISRLKAPLYPIVNLSVVHLCAWLLHVLLLGVSYLEQVLHFLAPAVAVGVN